MSIASRITNIKGHIEDDYNALERLGADLTGVDKNIENIASVVNSIYDKLPKVTGTGSDLSLTPTLKGGLNILPLGNAEQNSYNGKNLLNASAESYTLPASTTNYQTIANIDLVANTKYYISYNIDNTSSSNTRSTPRLYYQQQYIESGSTNYNLTTGRKVWEFTPSASGTYQFQYWLQNSNVAVTVSKFMISTSSDTTYEKYVGEIPSPNPSYPQSIKVVTGDNDVVVSNSDNTQSQTYTLHLGSLELCKIGTYQDVITGTKDNWKVVKNIQKLSVDNNTEITTSSTNTSGIIRLQIPVANILRPSGNGVAGQILATHYLKKSSNQTYLNNVGISIDATTNRIFIYDTNYNTSESVTSFKQWAENSNLTIYYVLATPTEETITDTTLINELNGLQELLSYDGTTNISITSDSNNAQMLAEVRCLKGE